MEFTSLPRLDVTPRAQAVSALLRSRTVGAIGTIDPNETDFLLTAMELCDARTVVEIGVSSGASSLYILGMLNELGRNRRLFSFDALDYYYGDPKRLVGYLATQSEYNDPGRFILRSNAYSADARSTLLSHSAGAGALDEVDLVFIDGSHRHPWATLDLLLLLPLIREGGIVVLHDINLPNLTGLNEDFGPMILFGLPFEERVVVASASPNIGYIRIRGKKRIIDLAVNGLATQWETKLQPKLEEKIILELGRDFWAAQIAPLILG